MHICMCGMSAKFFCSYINQLYVRYNIVCPAGYNTAFFNITFSGLEPANCFNPNLNQDQ